MLTVNAYAAISPTEPLVKTTTTRRDLGPHDVLIRLEYAGSVTLTSTLSPPTPMTPSSSPASPLAEPEPLSIEGHPVNLRYDFTGQVALVTGASSGMGLTTAQAFAQARAAVVLGDINQDALRVAADELTATGHQAARPSPVTSPPRTRSPPWSTPPSPPSADSTWRSTTPASSAPPSDPLTSPPRTFDRVNADQPAAASGPA